MNTVNQLSFKRTLFCDFLEINCFVTTNSHNQDADYLKNNKPETLENWFTMKNICQDEALAVTVSLQ